MRTFRFLPALAVFLFFCGSPVRSQEKVREYLLLGVEIAEELTSAYTQPVTEGLLYGLTGGWYNSAVVRDKWDVEVSIVTNGAFVPSDARTFFIDTNRFENLTTRNGEARVEVPTILGGSARPMTLVANVQEEIFEFETPGGLGYQTSICCRMPFCRRKWGCPGQRNSPSGYFPRSM